MEIKNKLTLKWLLSIYFIISLVFLIIGANSDCGGTVVDAPDTIYPIVSLLIVLLAGPIIFLEGFGIGGYFVVIEYVLSSIVVFALFILSINASKQSNRKNSRTLFIISWIGLGLYAAISTGVACA